VLLQRPYDIVELTDKLISNSINDTDADTCHLGGGVV